MGSIGTSAVRSTGDLVAKVEQIRNESEVRRISETEKREKEKGTRTWNPEVGDRFTNVSYNRAELELFNAPLGTVISMHAHSSGDYVGEYTKTKDGWVGSQKYRSSYRKPPMVSTAKGFAMHVSGYDIKVVKR